MATPDEITGLLAYLLGAYPWFKPREMMDRVYCAELADLPIDRLRLAARAHVSTGNYFPSVHELRRRVLEMSPGRRVAWSGRDAWEKVAAEIERAGHLGQPQFDDPLTTGIVQDMGWRSLCLSDNLPAERRHFIERYDDRLRRETELALMPADLREQMTRLAQRLSGKPLPSGEGDRDRHRTR